MHDKLARSPVETFIICDYLNFNVNIWVLPQIHCIRHTLTQDSFPQLSIFFSTSPLTWCVYICHFVSLLFSQPLVIKCCLILQEALVLLISLIRQKNNNNQLVILIAKNIIIMFEFEELFIYLKMWERVKWMDLCNFCML